MNKTAIAFSTKDRVELSRRAVAPLLGCGEFDLFWMDGSSTAEGEQLPSKTSGITGALFVNIRGGADAAIVFSLTTLLNHVNHYEYVGLVENDVLLPPDWFEPTMQLFARGKAEGLEVGAVSTRCYEDRILIQRDGYAVCHNLGAGMVIFTRHAAELVLQNFRTGWWTENRRTFMQLAGLDIGHWGAFRLNEQWITADWHFDQVLAECGLASLALTPSPVEMIGQVPPLEQQGLKLATAPVEALRNDAAFDTYCERLAARYDNWCTTPNATQWHQADDGQWMIFPHQIHAMGGSYRGDWRLKWCQGYGPFAWKAGDILTDSLAEQALPSLRVMVSGSCSFLVSGGENGGMIKVRDTASGYDVSPSLPPEGPTGQVLNLAIPGGIIYREIEMTALSPGVVFYGLQTREPQPWLLGSTFDHSMLPPV